ncbi:hypothetical protein BDP27DRAFT_139036 [Rhodocollybia butyracea]|uniref:SH3 domain-containing protein n=1 Tax=Rhodocollybia butyracea TaxID=206335 RepID=A0A9P5UCW5_9AGAR|nr:hypothetical protein BDP27DRAFT_139036 [Rhodocollybia butyracea]
MPAKHKRVESASIPHFGGLFRVFVRLDAVTSCMDSRPRKSPVLTHAVSVDSAALPATHSMTLTGNPTPSAHPRALSNDSTSSSSTSSSSASYRIPLKIRDFTYAAPDPRHQGLGEDGRGKLNIPRENRVRAVYKLLLDEAGYKAWKAAAIGAEDSPDSDDSDADSEEEEDEEEEEGWDGEWTVPSDEQPHSLCPGLYRALYAFEPEGSREMALKEDQVVRVVGRGGGAGWAVVVVDGVDNEGRVRVSQKEQLALVPETYLELLTLDDNESSLS